MPVTPIYIYIYIYIYICIGHRQTVISIRARRGSNIKKILDQTPAQLSEFRPLQNI